MALPSYYKYLSQEEIAAEEGGAKASPSPTAPGAPAEAPAPTGPSATATITGDAESFSYLKDIATGVLGGARDAVQGVVTAPIDIAETVGGISKETAAGARKAVEFLPEVAEQGSVAGKIARGVTKFGLGMLGTGKVLGAFKAYNALTKTGTAGILAAQGIHGAIGQAVVTEHHEERLADLVQSLPILQNPIAEYLSANLYDEKGNKIGTKADESAAESRFKAAIDGIVPGVLVDSLFLGVKGIYKARALRNAGKPEAAAAVDIETAKVVDEAMQAASTKPMIAEAAVPETAQGTPVFHGTADTFTKANMEGGLWVAESSQVASNYADLRATTVKEGAAQVRPYYLDPSAKLAEDKDFIKRIYQGVPVEQIAKDLKAQGFDAMHFTKDVSGKGSGGTYLVFNPAKLTEKFTGEPADAVARAATAPADVKSFFKEPPKAPVLKPTVQMSPEQTELFRKNLVEQIHMGQDLDLPLEASVLNYSTMTDKNAVIRTMDMLALQFGDILKNAGGTFRSHEESIALANILGARPEVLRARVAQLAGATKNMDGYLLASKTWVQSQARDLADLAKRIEFGTAGPVAQAEFHNRTQILGEFMDNLGAIQTSAARTTSAGRIRTFDAKDADQVAKLLEKSGNSEATKNLAGRIRMAGDNYKGIIAAAQLPTVPQKITAVHNFVWMNSILSGLATTGVNLSSNLMQTLVRPGQRALGAILRGDGVEAKEAIYQYAALRHSLFDAWEMAKRSWSLDRSILDPQNIGTGATSRPISASYLGLDKDSPAAFATDWIGKVVGLPGRFLNSQDEFFKQINYRSHVMGEAWSEAADMVAKGKLQASMVGEFVDQKLAEAIGHMGQALNKPALRAAQEATFTQPLAREAWVGRASISELIAQGPGAHPWIRGTIMPFFRVPTNIFRTFVDTGPTALLTKQFYTDWKAGGEKAAMAMGKLTTGSALWAGALMLAGEGRVTGRGPADKDLQRQLRQNGWQPYSYVFANPDGTKTYVPIGRLDPFGMFFGIAADVHDVAGKIGTDNMTKLATSLVTAVAANISSKTYLRGIIDTSSLLGSGYDSEEKAKKFLMYRASSYVPSALKAFNPDDTLKEPRTMLDALMARIPGLSEGVEAKRDNFGKKFTAPGGYPYSAINPFVHTTEPGDKVRNELMSLAQTHAEAKFPIPPEKVGASRSIDLTELKSKTGQTAHDRWLELLGEMKLGGKTMHDSLDNLIGSDSYKKFRDRMGDSDPVYKQSFAVDQIKSRMDMYHKSAFLQLQREFPELKKAMLTDQINAAKVGVLGPSAAKPLAPLLQR